MAFPMTGHGEGRIEQRAEVDAPPERIFEVLADLTHVPHYAARIEGAEILEPGPDGGLVGTKIEMITTAGTPLMATIKSADPPREIVWEDENGLKSTWRIDPSSGRSVLTNVLEGPISGERARRLAYDADLKFQALTKALESRSKELHEGEGLSDIVGTPGGPRKD